MNAPFPDSDRPSRTELVARFESMLATTLDRSCSETFGDRWRQPCLSLGSVTQAHVALIGFCGIRHHGHVALAVPPETADRLASVGEGAGLLASDHVGELTNLLFGRVKAHLIRAGIEVYCGTPMVLHEVAVSVLPNHTEGPAVRRAMTVDTATGTMLAWVDLSIPGNLVETPIVVESTDEMPNPGEPILFDAWNSPSTAVERGPVVNESAWDCGGKPAKGPRPVVLFVDDEEPNRVVFAATVGRHFDTVVASSGSEALAVLDDRPVDVLITDNRMPKMTGIDLCERVRVRHPDVQRVLITAYSDLRTVAEAINRGGISRYVVKPWRVDDLESAICEAASAARVIGVARELRTASAMQDQVLQDLADLTSLVMARCAALEGVTRRSRHHLPESEAGELASEVAELRVAADALHALHTRLRSGTATLPVR